MLAEGGGGGRGDARATGAAGGGGSSSSGGGGHGGDGGCAVGGGGDAASAMGAIDASYSPEDVIERSALEEPSAACFLHQNYPDAFSDVAELAEAADAMSDAQSLVDAYRRRPWQHALLPYVASLAGRGVVTHNRTPAPSRFTQTRKPHVYQVEKDAAERRRRCVRAFNSAWLHDPMRPPAAGAAAERPGAVLGGGCIELGESRRRDRPIPRLIAAPARGGRRRRRTTRPTPPHAVRRPPPAPRQRGAVAPRR